MQRSRLGLGHWEVLHRIVGLDETAEALHNLRAVEKFAEEFDLFTEFLVGDGLDEFFGGDAGFGVELGDLLGHGTGDLQRVAFAGKVRHESGLMRGLGFDCAAGEEQIADETVADVATEARNAAKAGDKTESKLGKAEARHFVGDDQIAEQRELEAPAHTQAVNGGERDEWRRVDGVGDAMNALDESAQAGDAFLWRKMQRVGVKLLQVASNAEATGASAGDNARAGDRRKRVDGGGKLFEFAEQQRADFVEGFVVEREFDDTIAPFPAQAFAAEFFNGEQVAASFFHELLPAATACLLYI